MLKNGHRNFILYLKNELKNKTTINKSIIQNKQINVLNQTISQILLISKKKNQTSQLTGQSKQTKKKPRLSRWDLYHLYTVNEMPVFKKKLK